MLNRRKFLTTSTAATVASLLASSPLIASTMDAPKIKNVGLQLWSIAKWLEQDLTGYLQLLADIGYKELELFGPYPFSSQKDKENWKAITPMLGFSKSGYFGYTAKELKKLLDDKGLRTPAMHVGLDTLRNNLEETAEAAHILGQQYAGLAAIPEEERRTLDDYKRMADEFNTIGKKAKALGITLYYHNHGYGLTEMEGAIPFDVLVERTDPSLLSLEMDVFWFKAGGANPIEYLDKYPGRFKMMHVKDMKQQVRFSGDGGNPAQWIELFPYITDAGNGVLDLKTICTHAKKAGLKHFIIENDVITDPEDSLEKGYDFLASLRVR